MKKTKQEAEGPVRIGPDYSRRHPQKTQRRWTFEYAPEATVRVDLFGISDIQKTFTVGTVRVDLWIHARYTPIHASCGPTLHVIV